MRGLAVFLVSLCVGLASAQEVMDVTVTSVSYLKADSAELIKEPSSTLIVAEGLKPGTEYAAKLKVTNQDNDFIEVFPEKNPFPPKVIEPFKPGEYLIPGKRGDVFNVSVRGRTGRPVWLVVTIAGAGPVEPEKPTEPLPELSGLSKVSFEQAAKLNDAKTASLLAAAFRAVVTTVPVDKPLPDAVFEAKKARELVLLNRQGNVNWNAWLTAIDAELAKLKIKTTADYLKALSAIAGGLEKAAAAK
jgi:hypothetical protein